VAEAESPITSLLLTDDDRAEQVDKRTTAAILDFGR
jgi:hypothetical protein